MQNKAKLGQDRTSGKRPIREVNCAEQTQSGGTGRTCRGCRCCCYRSQVCETKPIPAGRDAAWGPGFPARPSGLAVNCAKQTQFRQRERKRQVLSGKGFMFNRAACGPRQNKANSGGWDAARPSPRPEALTMPPGTGASVQNEANSWPWRRGGGRGANAPNKANLPPTGPIAPNKANFGETRIGAKPFTGGDLCRVCPSQRVGKTKPIWEKSEV